MNNIYIFGSHSRAQTLGLYLTYLNPDIKIEAYLYNNDELNPETVDLVPVIKISQNSEGLCINYPVYIGTRGVYHDEIEKELEAIGFTDIRPVTVSLDLELRNSYLRKYFSSVGRDFIKFENLKSKSLENRSVLSSCIYVAKSVYDKVLNSSYRLEEYECEVQVGASLTDERLYDGIITDNTADNISEKNQQFCELTALYWIWKNSSDEVTGLVHYRRHFILPKNWSQIMNDNNVDVILPTPLYVSQSVEKNFIDRHDKIIWNTMLEILKERSPDCYNEAEVYFKGNLYSPCNMFIMKKKILDKFCSWLFPILFELEERIGVIDNRYLNRYPGFVSERLLSAYFEINREKYKIVYADKNFLM